MKDRVYYIDPNELRAEIYSIPEGVMGDSTKSLVSCYISTQKRIPAIPLGFIREEITRMEKLLKVIQEPAKRGELYTQIGTLERLIYDYVKDEE